MTPTKMYLGDAVYGVFDGDHILLQTNGVGEDATNRIYIDNSVWIALVAWVKGGYPDYNTGRKFNED